MNKGSGCPECNRLQDVALAGTRRCPPSSKEERQYANFLRFEKNRTYDDIALLLVRGRFTIARWCDPVQAEKNRERVRLQSAKNKASGHKAKLDKEYRNTPHGRASMTANGAMRRALEANAIFDIEDLDGSWITVNMYDAAKGDPGRKYFITDEDSKAYSTLRKSADVYEEWTGEPWNVDHLVPLSIGGSHEPANFACRTESINFSKSNKFVPADTGLFCRRIFGIEPGWAIGGIRINN